MRPRSISIEGWMEIERTAIERAKLLTDVELAAKHHVSRRRIQQIMQDARKLFLRNCVVPRETKLEHTESLCQNVEKASL